MTRRLTARVAAAGLAGAATFGVRAWWVRRKLVDQVAPDLRAPILWAPLRLTTTRTVLRLMSRLDLPEPEPPGDVSVERMVLPGRDGGPDVPAWVYRPLGDEEGSAPSGGLVWIHGGGYVLGSAATDHEVCARFVRQAGVVVVSPDYRLALSAPFPAALHDCWCALTWLRDQAESLATDPDRLAVAGESAGGGLAAALAQRAYDAGLPLRLQALVYPMLDDRTAAGRRAPTLVWDNVSNRRGWSTYLAHPVGQLERRPYAVPARRVDVTGLAPAWIGVGERDLFLDEDLTYADRLRTAGVRCATDVVPGMYHGAFGQAPADSANAEAFRARLVDVIRAALRPA